MFQSPQIPPPSTPSLPARGALQFPMGTVIAATMPLATFYQNENVRTADHGGRWENQFSFRWETFVFALRWPAENWQQSLTLKGKSVNTGGNVGEEGWNEAKRHTQLEKRAAWEKMLYYVWVYLHSGCLWCEAIMRGGDGTIDSPHLFMDRMRTTRDWGS